MSSVIPSPLMTVIPPATPQSPLGIIGGSSFLDSQYIRSFTQQSVNTPYGECILRANKDKSIYFVQRHGANPDHEYSPPHLINHKSIIHALYTLHVRHIIGFGSVGSLKPSLKPGTLITPDDYFNPFHPISFYEYGKSGHIVPTIDPVLRAYIHQLLQHHSVAHVSTGVYAQTHGPRFETPSEVRQLAAYADVVGMTCAHEATLTREYGISYGLICMVDNYGNGINVDGKPLTTQEFHDGVKRNLTTMEGVLGHVVQKASQA